MTIGSSSVSSDPILFDLTPGSGSSSPTSLANANGTLYFLTSSELWKIDPVTGNPVVVKDLAGIASLYSPPTYLTSVNGTLYLKASTSANGSELWKIDLATGDLTLIELEPGSSSSSPIDLTNINGILYFSAYTSANGSELWEIDSATSNPVRVTDINAGLAGSYVHGLTNSAGTLYFAAINNATLSKELWKVNPTTGDPNYVAAIEIGTVTAAPFNVASVNGETFFPAYRNTSGYELWKVNSTTGTPLQVTNIQPNLFNLAFLTNINGTLYFSAYNSTNGNELWKTDPATGNSVLLEIEPGSGSSSPENLTNVNGVLYFVATNSTSGRELWKIDPTTGTPKIVLDLNPGSASSNPRILGFENNKLYFSANNGTNGTELWILDLADLANKAPTNLTLSNITIDENKPIGTTIGNFVTVDPNSYDVFSYTLVDGVGDRNNSSFTIVGNELRTKTSFDFESKSSYQIRVRVTDQGGLFTEQVFTIQVNDLSTHVVVGSSADESLVATNEIDTIQAGSGNDKVTGKVSQLQSGDSFDGQDGIDTFALTGGSSTQTLSLNLGSSNQWSSLSGLTLSNITLKFFENVSLKSFEGSGFIVGSSVANTLIGGAGNDSLQGRGGDDTLEAGAGNDTLLGGLGNDNLKIDFANLQMGDQLDGNADIDTLILNGGTSSSSINLDLRQANQLVSTNGNPVTNLAIANFENVKFSQFLGNATVTGSNIANTLTGGAGHDQLNGADGNDTLIGNAGSDILTGGSGDDVLFLGTNDGAADQIIYKIGDGADKVYQFMQGVNGDQLRFSGIPNIDVCTVGTSTEFRVGDGISGNAGFGTGELLLKTVKTIGFVGSDVGVNLLNPTTPIGGFQFN